VVGQTDAKTAWLKTAVTDVQVEATSAAARIGRAAAIATAVATAIATDIVAALIADIVATLVDNALILDDSSLDNLARHHLDVLSWPNG
jgi:hypothetical protein